MPVITITCEESSFHFFLLDLLEAVIERKIVVDERTEKHGGACERESRSYVRL